MVRKITRKTDNALCFAVACILATFALFVVSGSPICIGAMFFEVGIFVYGLKIDHKKGDG